MNLCPTCNHPARVLFSRKYEQGFLRYRKHRCPNGHEFSTMEMPEQVFKDQEQKLRTRLDQFIRGVQTRKLWEDLRAQIDELLNEGIREDVIASQVGCSKSLVRKRIRELQMICT